MLHIIINARMRIVGLVLVPITAIYVIVSVGALPLKATDLSPADAKPSKCRADLAISVGDETFKSRIEKLSEGYKLKGDSWLKVDLCSPGVLQIVARGVLGGDEPPELTVFRSESILMNEAIARKKVVNVNVESAGSVYLGYFNDYYSSEVRMAYLKNLQIHSMSCNTIKSIDMPKDTGGTWDAKENSGNLVFDTPMRVYPCGSGQLLLMVKGKESDHQFPQLTFFQDGKIIKRYITSEDWTKIQMNVSAAALNIKLDNPHFIELADRNLIIEKIEFFPNK